MTEELQKCNNELCPFKDKCLRYSTTATKMYVPVGKENRTLGSVRACNMYVPKTENS